MPATLRKPRTQRPLLEQVAGSSSPLQVDEAKGIIFRVKVLGRFSKNNHNVREAENGTEYSPAAMKAALPLYEGKKVKVDHPPNRANPSAERSIEDTFGVLRHCVVESDENGEPAIWADLHYLASHPTAARVVEDVQKGLGVYGLSHNAAAGRERFDRASRRLVIEEIALVRSVDLVDKPATNRNLWESEHVSKTFRQILESFLPKLSKRRTGWAKLLLEDDGMAATMDAPVAEDDAGGEPDDALWAGFQAAISKIMDQYKDGTIDCKTATKQIGDYLKTHDKLTGSPGAEPEEAPEKLDDIQETVGDGSKNQKGQNGAMEFYDEWDRPSKKESEDQSVEFARLKHKEKVRELCESENFVPTNLQLNALCGLRSKAEAKNLIESFKAQKPSGFRPPKSIAPGTIDKTKGGKTSDPREVTESVADDLAALRCE